MFSSSKTCSTLQILLTPERVTFTSRFSPSFSPSSAGGVTVSGDTLTFCFTYVGVHLPVASADRSINPGTSARSAWTLVIATNFDPLGLRKTAVGICHSVCSAYRTINHQTNCGLCRATWTPPFALHGCPLAPCKTAVRMGLPVFTAYRHVNFGTPAHFLAWALS